MQSVTETLSCCMLLTRKCKQDIVAMLHIVTNCVLVISWKAVDGGSPELGTGKPSRCCKSTCIHPLVELRLKRSSYVTEYSFIFSFHAYTPCEQYKIRCSSMREIVFRFRFECGESFCILNILSRLTLNMNLVDGRGHPRRVLLGAADTRPHVGFL